MLLIYARFVVIAAVLTGIIWAQTEKEYEEWMHSVRDKVGSLRKNLETKNAEAASADAKELQQIFQKVHDFWDKKNIPDARRFALAAQGGFQQVGTAAAAGNFESASAQMKETMSSCAGCHNAHREKTADGFKMKY